MTSGAATVGRRGAGRKAGPSQLRPGWDAELRELRYEGQLVHRFTRRAPVAEFILRVFQEQGWSWRIDDPLPPRAGRPQAVRLRNEVHALNRRLMHPLIKFFMDGTGQGICWRPNSGGRHARAVARGRQ